MHTLTNTHTHTKLSPSTILYLLNSSILSQEKKGLFEFYRIFTTQKLFPTSYKTIFIDKKSKDEIFFSLFFKTA